MQMVILSFEASIMHQLLMHMVKLTWILLIHFALFYIELWEINSKDALTIPLNLFTELVFTISVDQT